KPRFRGNCTMQRMSFLFGLWLAAISAAAAIPEDFPQFQVPAHEKEMATVRELFWLHYPGAGPKATLWDEWLPDASLWPAVSAEHYADTMRQQCGTSSTAAVLIPKG